jgi:hypothetical protein
MANLSERSRRGQILLITGFALAVAFIGLALVLNSVIFTENLATRSESTTTSDAITHANSIEDAAEGLVEYVNTYNTTNSSSYDSVGQNLTRGFENVSTVATQHQLYDGRVVNDTLLRYDNGTVIRQTNESRSFTDDDGTREWEPIGSNANDVRKFRIHVFDAGDELDGSDDTPFNVTLTDTSGQEWRMNISENPGLPGLTTDHFVGVETPGGGYTCEATDLDEFWVNVSAGTVAGSECPDFDFAEGLSTIDEIEFNNGEDINGTYRLLVNKSFGSVNSGPYATGTGQPYIQPAVYAADIRVAYNSRVTSYETDLRVVPGEGDD